MSIRIKEEKCVGCKQCIEVCPGNLIQLNENKKAEIKYPKDCWGCTSCLKECNSEAIRFFLGADLGGRGKEMYTKREGSIINWILEQEGTDPIVLKVDSKDSNQY